MFPADGGGWVSTGVFFHPFVLLLHGSMCQWFAARETCQWFAVRDTSVARLAHSGGDTNVCVWPWTTVSKTDCLKNMYVEFFFFF